MFDSESERELRRLFEARSASRPDHAGALEGRLLAAFAARYPKKEKISMNKLILRRALVASAVVSALGIAACAAPVDLDVEVGRSLAIQYDVGAAGSPEPEKIAEFLRAEVKADGAKKPEGARKVAVRLAREGDAVTLEAELWGTGAIQGPLAPRLKAAFPALAGAQIKEELHQSKVRSTLARRVGHELFDLDELDEADVETAQRRIMEQLAARGIQGNVDVKVEGEGGERRVMIRVERQDCDGGPGGGAAK